MKILTIDQMHSIAVERNGRCLSESYKNAKSNLIWECSNRHTWEATPDNIKKGTWCPYCSCSSHVNEEKCRHILEKLTRRPFPRNYTILGNRQSLDGYCEPLKVAFEFNGIQHYKYVDFFHKTKNDFEDQQHRDRVKAYLCKQFDIRLIVIPYNHVDQITLIKSELTNMKIRVRDLKHFSFADIRKKNNKLMECQSFARDKNWNCLSEAFFTVGSSMTWMCNLGHVWKSCWSNIRKGSGCPKCHKNKLSKLFAKYNISDMLKIARYRDGTCLSDEYINCKTHLRWQCSKNHTWNATPEKVMTGQWCRKCYDERRCNSRK